MSSQQKQPAKKTTGTRSRTGCWTCRARRKKCDESRPVCTQCVNKGIPCGGYGARLKWGNGIASRGYLTGASIPVQGAGKKGGGGGGAGAKGRKRDGDGGERRKGGSVSVSMSSAGSTGGGGAVGKKVEPYRSGELVLDFGIAPVQNEAAPMAAESINERPSIDSNVPTPETTSTDGLAPGGLQLGAFDARLLQEFQEWGSFFLWVSSDSLQPPFHDVLALCTQSKSLLANCLTFQLSLHPEYEDRFDEYHAESLKLFRQDVAEPGNVMKDAILVSGILLCSIEMTRCMAWTVHLNGMYSILQYRHTVSTPTAVTSDIVDTIGFLDMPTHIIGRRSQTLNIWRDYCRGKSGIEPVSGLPYSLIDLFSMISVPDIELQFWTWTGAGIQAKPFQRRAWDAIRFAGIICARQQQQYGSATPFQHAATGQPTETLVQAIVDCLQDLLQTPQDSPCPFLNLLLFPAFIAGTQTHVLSVPQTTCIDTFWNDFFLGNEDGSPMLEAPLDLLHEMWTNRKGRTADQIALEWELEIGLF